MWSLKVKQKNQKGEVLLITTILLLVMVVIVEACATTASIQLNMGYMQRNNSNTYYLAKSGVEKGVNIINQGIQAQMPTIIEDFKTTYISPLTDKRRVQNYASSGGTNHTFEGFYYCNNIACTIPEHKYSKLLYDGETISVDSTVLSNYIRERIYQYVQDEYMSDTGNGILYSYIVDGDSNGTETQVTITFDNAEPTDTTSFVISCTAERTDGSSSHTVEGIVDISVPENISNELIDKYEWLYNPPEILDSAITVFSDLVVTNDAQLTVVGDIRVGGTTTKTTTTKRNGQTVLDAPDTEESGGVVASNGGRITVKSGSSSNNSTNSGSIYTLNNVITTHGWQPNSTYTNTLTANYTRVNKSYIRVEQGDIIANTVSIVDDFYSNGYNQNPMDGNKLVTGNNITVGGNIFVDNDVKIDTYVLDSQIQVNGSIFGISDGTLGDVYNLQIKNAQGTLVSVQSKDPNQSSSVLNRGQGTSIIKADGIYVNGQPYIDLGNGIPAALLESVGEPFQEVHTFPGYNETPPDPAGNDAYLDPNVNTLYDFIKLDKVEVTDSNKIYTPDTYVSAIVGSNIPSINKYPNSYLTNKSSALNFFYRGNSNVTLRTLTGSSRYDNLFALMYNTDTYYTANSMYKNLAGMYNKEFIDTMYSDVTENYQGLRGYMTAKRSVFYQKFDKSTNQLLTSTFNQLVDLDKITNSSHWSISNPIKVVNGGTIDIADFYASVDGGFTQPYPTIIINKGGNLKIKGSVGETFKGIIISKGNVTLEGNFTIEGSIIIDGTTKSDREEIVLGKGVGLFLTGSTTNVTIIHNPNIILQMNFMQSETFRSVLDALKITQFKDSSNNTNNNLAVVYGPYVSNTLKYTQGRVKLTDESILKLETKQINVKIKHIKKVSE